MAHAGQSSAEQDVPHCVWLFAELHGCCSYSLPWCPIPPYHIQQCLAVSITPHTACRREQLRFFFLLALQQTALGTTAIVIKSLGKYMQIAEVLYKPTHIWQVHDEATRAKQCFYVNSLSVSERLHCTEHSDAQKTLVQKPVALLRALLIIWEAFRAPDHRSTNAVPALCPPALSFLFDLWAAKYFLTSLRAVTNTILQNLCHFWAILFHVVSHS